MHWYKSYQEIGMKRSNTIAVFRFTVFIHYPNAAQHCDSIWKTTNNRKENVSTSQFILNICIESIKYVLCARLVSVSKMLARIIAASSIYVPSNMWLPVWERESRFNYTTGTETLYTKCLRTKWIAITLNFTSTSNKLCVCVCVEATRDFCKTELQTRRRKSLTTWFQ